MVLLQLPGPLGAKKSLCLCRCFWQHSVWPGEPCSLPSYTTELFAILKGFSFAKGPCRVHTDCETIVKQFRTLLDTGKMHHLRSHITWWHWLWKLISSANNGSPYLWKPCDAVRTLRIRCLSVLSLNHSLQVIQTQSSIS